MGLDCDKIIYNQKGSITCKSALGEDDTFIVSLSEKPADLLNSIPLKKFFWKLKLILKEFYKGNERF